MHTHSNNGGDLPKAVEVSNLSKSLRICTHIFTYTYTQIYAYP